MSETSGVTVDFDPGHFEPGRIVWTHSGYRYALGYVHDHYGIFEKETWQNGPKLAFPGNDQGWDEALQAFSELEPWGYVTVVED
jgi:hypothetical protein